MLPTLPFDLLPLLTAFTIAAFCGIFGAIVGRRTWIYWRGRREETLALKFEMLLLEFLMDQSKTRELERYLNYADRQELRAFALTVKKIEKNDGVDLCSALAATGVPDKLERRLLQARSVWARAEAARAIGLLKFDASIKALDYALDDRDPIVAYLAGGALAEFNRPDTALIIFKHMNPESRLNTSRLAAMIEAMTCDVGPVIREVFTWNEPSSLFWAIDLTGTKKCFELIQDIRPFIAHENANVRAATAETIGNLAVPLTDRWLTPLLNDSAWFVVSHAVKSLGQLRSRWAVPYLAELLSSENWWVRQNSITGLVEIEDGVPEVVEGLLDSPDRFARNCAVEVLERTGWLEQTLEEIALGRTQAKDRLDAFVSAGGIGYLENALPTAPESSVGIVLEMLYRMGDDATVGRIRACLQYQQIPEQFRVRANEVAVALRGV